MTVLVAYGSVYGSTQGIAERIAVRLEQHHLDVETRSVDDANELDRYAAFVIGSAIHAHAWLPNASRFIRDNAHVLSERPTWLFSVGMPGAVGPPFRKLAMSEGPIVAEEFQCLIHPRAHRLFSGVVRRSHFPDLRSRIAFRAMGCHYGDFRNWHEIDAWADEIAGHLARGHYTGQTVGSG